MLKNKVIIILTILIIACFLFYPKSKPEIKIIDQEPQTNEEELKEKIKFYAGWGVVNGRGLWTLSQPVLILFQ